MRTPPPTPRPPPQTLQTSRKRKAPESPTAENFHDSAPNLETARRKLVECFRDIPVVSLSEFFEHYISSVSAGVLEEIIKKLEVDSQGIYNGKVYGYVGKMTSRKAAVEADSLGSFIQLVIMLAGEYEKKEPLIGHSAKESLLSSEMVNSSRPNSYLYIRAKNVMGKEAGWEQLLAVGELKKRTDDTRENWAQVLWGMHHIMRNDPCRCKTYGYSVEDDQARLWCYSRASVVVTEKFNWIEVSYLQIHGLRRLTSSTALSRTPSILSSSSSHLPSLMRNTFRLQETNS
ncbi:hypothetical protein L218DRAFT_89490 [Marasmius fiardii PR-910]|nr:hypothetical protein L218DRAFT_89490 [Marasmius fiardii PR-910]